MPKLQPIPTIRYSTQSGDLSALIAPPYDVLDEIPKQQLLARDPHNIVAIDLPVTPPKTVGPDSAYQLAADTFNNWLNSGILKRDNTPHIFAYEQIYTVNNRTFHRRGIIAGLEVEPFGRPHGGIHRHEMTIQGGTDDRYKLMAATLAQLSPVFGVYHDPQAQVVNSLAKLFDSPPDFFGSTTNDNVQHRVWIINDPATTSSLQQFFNQTDVFIADGHHRYTTALNFQKKGTGVVSEKEKKVSGTFSTNCLFVLVAVEDPGMIVLPTHRIIRGLQNFTLNKLAALITKRSDLKLTPANYAHADLDSLVAALPGSGHHAMGLFDPATNRCFILTTANPDPLKSSLSDKPEVWRKLDVAILHELILDRILKPSFAGTDFGFLYSADIAETLRIARAQPNRLAIFLQPTRLNDVCAVSLAGQVMPPKSTFFFPKLATGLIIHPLK